MNKMLSSFFVNENWKITSRDDLRFTWNNTNVPAIIVIIFQNGYAYKIFILENLHNK